MEPHVKRAYILLALLMIVANILPIPVSVHMLITTLIIIYIGAHSSVPGSQTGGKAEEQQFSEQMQTRDAMMFPIVGSIVLFSLYIVFKFIPKEYITIVIKAYFFIFGLLVLGHRFSYILNHFLPSSITTPFRTISITLSNPFSRLPKDATPQQVATWKLENSLTLTGVDILGFIVATGVATWYVYTNHWTASNIFGIAFSIQGIELISLGSFQNGCILLSGLFVYDIFWVFGTDVMVTVAKSFDAPIKLLFPQTAAGLSPSMLGLGDVVLPGVFIALMLRFDLSFHHNEQRMKYHKKINQNKGKGKKSSSKKDTSAPRPFTPTYVSSGSIPTPYFHSQMLCYFIGLSTTVFVMYYFNHAQPALLYLVPTCFIASFGTALIRGEFRQLLAFKEQEPHAPHEILAKKIVQKTKPLEMSMEEENVKTEEEEEEEEEGEEEEQEEEQSEDEDWESVEHEPEPEPVKAKKTAAGKAKAAIQSTSAPAPAKKAAPTTTPAPAPAAAPKVSAPAPKKKSGKK